MQPKCNSNATQMSKKRCLLDAQGRIWGEIWGMQTCLFAVWEGSLEEVGHVTCKHFSKTRMDLLVPAKFRRSDGKVMALCPQKGVVLDVHMASKSMQAAIQQHDVFVQPSDVF